MFVTSWFLKSKMIVNAIHRFFVLNLVPVSNVMVNRNNQQPIVNQSFTLTCTASGDVEHIWWMKNGTNLDSNNRINFTDNHSVLNFNTLTLSDNGHYQCVASNAVNNMTSQAYDLKVFCE